MSKHGLGDFFKLSAALALVGGLLLPGSIAHAVTGELVSEPTGIIAPEAAVEGAPAEIDVEGALAAVAAAVQASPGDEAAIFTAVNNARLAACRPILNRNAAVDKVALNWSREMASTGVFKHNPKYSEQIPSGWFNAGENIAAGYRTGNLMFQGWMTSPGHKANILSASYTDIGIGFVRGGIGYSTYGTQNFVTYNEHEGGKFLDVRPFSKFYTEIEWMAQRGLSTGIKVDGCGSAKVFSPKNGTTREAMSAFLYRINDLSGYKASQTPRFADVPKSHKFYKQIQWMGDTGVSTGTVRNGKRYFDPSRDVTREAMSAFLYRMDSTSGDKASETPRFVDVPKNHKFYKQIQWMGDTGLSTGIKRNGKAYYDPNSKVTREAMAAFLHRFEN